MDQPWWFASYDGTVRWLDVESGVYQPLFATYDDSPQNKNKTGYGLDEGYRSWVQYVCTDHRTNSEKCLFLSTSTGQVCHVDMRLPQGKLSFRETLSEKKINSLSLHPNGYSFISAGLDGTVKLWDIRKFGTPTKKRSQKPIAEYFSSKSVNSAFFSPSGKTVVSTTMADYLDLFDNIHLSNKGSKTKPIRKIRHNNATGRWLSTLMAKWHPALDMFVVGSMRKPRTIEVFDQGGNELAALQGDALTAVCSRCCFHPSPDTLTILGGNSSGRITVVQQPQ